MTITSKEVAELRAKATPGPWHFGDKVLCSDQEKVWHGALGLIAIVGNADKQITQRYAKPNAALIAATPDMADLIAAQAAIIAELRTGEAQMEKQWNDLQNLLGSRDAEIERLRGAAQRLEIASRGRGYVDLGEFDLALLALIETLKDQTQ